MWQVSWGHPKFGGILASCSFDHRVIIWKELHEGSWQQARVMAPAHAATWYVSATARSTEAPGSRGGARLCPASDVTRRQSDVRLHC